MFRRAICLLSAVALSATACMAADHGPAVTDPAQAGPDFQIQGEYSGTLSTDQGPVKIGLQMLALGDGKFRAVGYEGGLPGDGWRRGDNIYTAEGEMKDGKAVCTGPDGSVEVDGATAKVTSPEGQALGELKKVDRKSPTLGVKAPEGAVVLFDGTTADKFDGGQMTDDGLLKVGCSSKQKFGDHTLHIEFRTPFMPEARGQGRGNSGVYIQGRYELQVLDSFALEGLDNECGGIYQIARPIVNMCLPPLSWQTYDIDFTAAKYDESGNKTENARVTIRHNGVVIHDNLELAHATPGYHGEGPGPDVLFLQDHGNPVVFRNIWAIEK